MHTYTDLLEAVLELKLFSGCESNFEKCHFEHCEWAEFRSRGGKYYIQYLKFENKTSFEVHMDWRDNYGNIVSVDFDDDCVRVEVIGGKYYLNVGGLNVRIDRNNIKRDIVC